jgi:BlaI family transcriptional regulator, penicillinase repressor
MRPRKSTLTDQELEIMKIVWSRDSSTVRDVYEEMLKRRKIAYTTVMTVMRTLEQKGYLKSSQDDRAYVYVPTRPKNQVIKGMVSEFVDRVFNGSAERLVAHLLEDRHLSESDLREIARMIGKGKS